MLSKEEIKAKGLDEVYKMYLEEIKAIEEECIEEGYPAHGSNYELRVEELEKYYPDLFPQDEEVINDDNDDYYFPGWEEFWKDFEEE